MGKRKYWATYGDYFGNIELFGNTNNSKTLKNLNLFVVLQFQGGLLSHI